MKKRAVKILIFHLSLLCVQALKAHLTHNSLSSRQLVEKFLERKIWEQVRQPPPARNASQDHVKLVLVVPSFCSTERVQWGEIWRSHPPHVLQEIRPKTQS